MDGFPKSCLSFLVLLNCTSLAQTIYRPVSAIYSAQNTYAQNHVDVFATQKNQAALMKLSDITVGVYSEKRFLLEALNFVQSIAVFPTSSGNFSVHTLYFGNQSYNETKMGLAFAKKLSERATMGVQLNNYKKSTLGYGKFYAFNFEIGMIVQIAEKWQGGIHVFNPVGGKFGKNSDEKLPSIYSLGCGYTVSEKFFVEMEIEKEEKQKLNLNAGFQYRFLPQLQFSSSVKTREAVLCFGVAVFIKSFLFEVVASRHPQLGITPGMQLSYAIQKRKQ